MIVRRTLSPIAVRYLAALLVLCLGSTGLVRGQTTDRDASIRFRTMDPFEQLRQRTVAATPTAPLEGAVDPEEYTVGPGDVFSIYIGGSQPVTLTQPVSADGYLILPETSGFSVAGQSLAEVRQRAVSVLHSQFRNVSVDVSLAQPRQFYVHVSGAVPIAGRFLATPVARVSSVLEQAFADTTQAPVTNPAYRPSLRNVTLLRRDGTRQSVDLMRYFATGNTAHDPYLQDGDVVSVPAYNPEHEAVFIDGAVAFPGTYAYRPGDTVQDLLALATGDQTPNVPGAVRLARLTESGQLETRVLTADAGAELQPLDHVYVAPARRDGGTVTVTGAVEQPGTYPIEAGRTTLQDLLTLVELRPNALARGAYLERAALPTVTPTKLPGRFDLDRLQRRNLQADSARAVHQSVRLASFDYFSRAYLTTELRTQNRVSVDLTKIRASDAEPIYLEDGDRLVVPRDEQTIYVFGQVNRPGFMTYRTGWNAQDYIRSAGGRGPLAEHTYVIEAGTGRYVPADQADIQSGDMIFINRRDALIASPEMQRLALEEQRTRADMRFRTAQTIFQTVGVVTSLVTTYLLVRREFN